MKITMEIDCTSEEMRDLLGLPDVKTMQNEMMQEIRGRMMAGLDAMDPTEALKTWMPGVTGLDQLQNFFAMMAPGGRKKE